MAASFVTSSAASGSLISVARERQEAVLSQPGLKGLPQG
jgi:hypothetical protein